MPPILWTDAESDYLIRQRRHHNDEFYNILGRSWARFWENVARRINRHFIFVGEEEDTQAGNVNKNGEICFATIE